MPPDLKPFVHFFFTHPLFWRKQSTKILALFQDLCEYESVLRKTIDQIGNIFMKSNSIPLNWICYNFTSFFFYISDSAEFPTYVDDDYEYEKPSSKRSDHLLRFARRLNGNDDDIFAKRGGDDHFLCFAKRYGYFSHFLALFYNFSDRYDHYYKWRRPLPSFR